MRAPLTIRLALVLGVMASCAHTPPPPPGALSAAGLKRFYQIAQYIYRSAQPNAQELQIMHASYNIVETIKLNHTWESREPAVMGVTTVQRPWLNLGPVEHEDVSFILDEMDACVRERRNCVVHCTLGIDRTGLAIALWQARNHLKSPDDAFKEWVAYGSERFYLLEKTFEREVRLMGSDWKLP